MRLCRRPLYQNDDTVVYCAAETVVPDNPAAWIQIMTDLMQIISNGQDLRNFSNELINRAVTEVAAAVKAAEEEKLLTREEVKEMCNVCDTTLWLWNKRNYLKVVKVGNKVRYRLTDVKRILGKTGKCSGDGRE